MPHEHPQGRNWVGTLLASALPALTPGTEGSGGGCPDAQPGRGRRARKQPAVCLGREGPAVRESALRAGLEEPETLGIFSSCLKGRCTELTRSPGGLISRPRPACGPAPHGALSARGHVRQAAAETGSPVCRASFGDQGCSLHFMAKTLTQLPPREFFSEVHRASGAAECVGGGWDTFSVWSSVNRMGSHTKK